MVFGPGTASDPVTVAGREGANQNRGFGCPHIPAEEILYRTQGGEQSGPQEGDWNTRAITGKKLQGKRWGQIQHRRFGKAKTQREPWRIQEPQGLGPMGRGLTRSLPPVARLLPSELKLQQLMGPTCPLSSEPQGKPSAFCGNVSNCLGHSSTMKSSEAEARSSWEVASPSTGFWYLDRCQRA